MLKKRLIIKVTNIDNIYLINPDYVNEPGNFISVLV